MAKLSTVFELVDKMSDKLEKISNCGADSVDQWERMGEAADNACGKATAAAKSISSATDDASDAAERAASNTHGWAESINNYHEQASKAADSTENLADVSQQAENAIHAEAEAMGDAEKAADELGDAAEDAGDKGEKLGNKGSDAMKQLSNTMSSLGVVAAVKQLGDAMMYASDAAANLETSTAKVSTIYDSTQKGIGEIRGEILELSGETGKSTDELLDSVYNAISATGDTANAVGLVTTATKLATAGFAESGDSLGVLTTITNAYKKSASEVEAISDSLIMTQNLGVTTVAELSANMGKAIATASAYSVDLYNVESAYVSMTKAGINTAETTTYMSSMLNELGSATSDVAGIIKEQTGASFSMLMQEGWSLADVLGVLYDAVGNDTNALMNLWGSAEAGKAANAILSQGLDQFNGNLTALSNSAGATEKAFKTMASTTQTSENRMNQAGQNLAATYGSTLNPAISTMYDLWGSVLNAMSDFVTEHPVVTKAITAIAVGLGVAAVSAVAYTTATTVLIPAVTSFGVALNTALGPIGWVALGITAVVAAGTALVAMMSDSQDETAGMTAVTREQYYELKDLNAEYERAVETYGQNSEEALRLKYQVDDLSEAFANNQQTVEEFEAEVDALSASVHELSTNFHDAITDINANETGTLALIQKYQDLTEKAVLTAGEQQQLEAVTHKLADAFPDLTENLDSSVMSIDAYIAAMKRSAEEQAKQQRQDEAQTAYVDALAKRAELTEELEKAQANYNAELEAHGMVWDETRQTYYNGTYTEDSLWAKWTTDLDVYGDALDTVNGSIAENEALIEELESGFEKLAEEEQNSVQEAMTYDEAAATAFGNVKDRLDELVVAYNDAYQAAYDSFQGQFGLFEEASADMDATVERAQAAMDSQLAYWSTYAENINVLKNTSAEDLGITQENYELIMQQVQDGSAQAAGLAQSMVDAINSGNEDAIGKLAETAGAVDAKQKEIADSTAAWKTDFEAKMDEITKEMEGYVADLGFEAEAEKAAADTMSSYAASIRAGKNEAVTAANAVANAVERALSAANPTIRVNVVQNGTIPGHATGTTNAEDIFIAGEEGPELIVGHAGSTVFPTAETDRLIEAISNGNEYRSSESAENATSVGATFGEFGASPVVMPMLIPDSDGVHGIDSGTSDKKITLEINGRGNIQLQGGNVDKSAMLEFLLENMKPVLTNILMEEIYEEGDGSYEY